MSLIETKFGLLAEFPEDCFSLETAKKLYAHKKSVAIYRHTKTGAIRISHSININNIVGNSDYGQAYDSEELIFAYKGGYFIKGSALVLRKLSKQ